MPDSQRGQKAGQPYRRFLARLQEARSQGVALGLDRVRLALERLGTPEQRVPAVHIAGTNGKGSCAALTDSILRQAGLRTGLFTSPHLSRFTERIRIDGVEIDGDRLALLDEAVVATGVSLTFFEVSAVLAFLAFAEAKVDVAILETGLGGRLDATNVCHPLACAITSIALDHEAILGNTVRAIAYEKAGIAKPGIPLYLGPLSPEADDCIAGVASATGAPVRRPGVDYPPAPVAPALPGAHQLANAGLAVAISRHAAHALGRPLGDGDVLRGLAEVRWPGRLERIADDVLLDCAHNVEGTMALVAALPPAPRRVLVTSIVRDKNAAGMLSLLAPEFDCVVLTRSQSERAAEPEQLAALVFRTRAGANAQAKGEANAETNGEAHGENRQVVCVEDPVAAFALARSKAHEVPGGLVVVAGSIFLVGALRAHILGHEESIAEASDPLP
ncbi:MAG TPA: folylpolyglutamate synthase/dihydrofolate synthase family protein [Polyangia bacterium]